MADRLCHPAGPRPGYAERPRWGWRDRRRPVWHLDVARQRRHGDLETFVADIIPQAPILAYANEACRIAKADHAAEYERRHARKAALKVRSVWRDASAAGGYGHLVRNLPLTQTPACDAFVAWFRTLFLTT
jgi:hypothetical protein